MNNKKVTVCLEALFNRLTGHDTEEEYVPTEYGYIQKETNGDKEWFDFKNDDGTPCMDGETCEIIEETEQYIVLQEVDEQIPFKLSREEFEIATVECNTQFKEEINIERKIAEFIFGMVDMSVASELSEEEQLQIIEKDLKNIKDLNIYYYLESACNNKRR